MANWQHKLEIKDSWSKAREGETSIQELSKEIAAKLRALCPFKDESLDEEREEIAYDFEYLSEQPNAGASEFDEIMDRLYNWGDTSLDDAWPPKKACWIATEV